MLSLFYVPEKVVLLVRDIRTLAGKRCSDDKGQGEMLKPQSLSTFRQKNKPRGRSGRSFRRQNAEVVIAKGFIMAFVRIIVFSAEVGTVELTCQDSDKE